MKDLIYEFVVAWDGYYWVRTPGVSLSLERWELLDYCYKQVQVPGTFIDRLKLAWELYRNGRHVREIKAWSDKEV